jgi:hypothetical protein
MSLWRTVGDAADGRPEQQRECAGGADQGGQSGVVQAARIGRLQTGLGHACQGGVLVVESRQEVERGADAGEQPAARVGVKGRVLGPVAGAACWWCVRWWLWRSGRLVVCGGRICG